MSDPHAHLRSDDALEPLVEEYGELTIEPAENLFERLVVAIIRQQLSMAAADTIRSRLFERHEVSPHNLRDIGTDELTDTGLSNRKAKTIQRAARRFHERDYSQSRLASRSTEDVIDELTDITGIGPWTAKMVCIFGLGHQDVFPVEDLGIRNGMQTLFDDDLTRQEMVERSKPWRPYRSIASQYLWRRND